MPKDENNEWYPLEFPSGMSTSKQRRRTKCNHRLLRLSSENGLDGLRVLDRPRLTLKDPGDALVLDDDLSSVFDFLRLRLLRRPARLGERECGVSLTAPCWDIGSEDD